MKVLSDLAKGKVLPVYVLYGDEPAPMHQVVEAIRKAVLEPGTEAFNHERFAGRELDGVGRVLDACAQVPMMAARRLVELHDPEAVGKGRGSAEGKGTLDALAAYVAAPVESTVLVLVSSGIDGRSKLVTAGKKTGVVLKFEQLKKDGDAVDFVREQARSRGIDIDRDAVLQLVALVGTGQSELLAALDRASLHAGAGRVVSVDDVEAVVVHTREAVIFELTDAVGMGRRDKALAVLAHMFTESSTSEIGQVTAVLSMLVRQLRLVFLAKAAGGHPARIEALAGVPGFVARKLAEQERGWDEPRLRRAFAGLARLDRDLKGGSFAVARAPYVALQRWILEVCDALPGAAPRV